MPSHLLMLSIGGIQERVSMINSVILGSSHDPSGGRRDDDGGWGVCETVSTAQAHADLADLQGSGPQTDDQSFDHQDNAALRVSQAFRGCMVL